MTVLAVFADPPWPGTVLSRVVAETPLSAEDAATLYEATLSDTVRAVATSGGDLLVNYPPGASPPEQTANDAETDPERSVRRVVEAALADLEGDPHVEEPRYEPRVGSSGAAAAAGNTVTHLLREEGAESAAVVWPTAPLAGRKEIDGAAMKLRNAATVLGPTESGDVFYAGFTEPVDFEDSLRPPAAGTLAGRATDAGHRPDFLSVVPSVATPTGLATTTTLVRARERAGRAVPRYTAAAVKTLGLRVVESEREPGVKVTVD